MKQLLEQSKQQLLNPLGEARRKLLIILNIVYVVLVPFFLISEKVATGNFVNDSLLYLVYGTAILLNALSALYNIKIFRKANRRPVAENNKEGRFIRKNQKRLDLFFGYASVLPILFMSLCNMMGLGNPFNDSILTDFALAQSLMIVVVMIIGRIGVFIWFLILVLVLFWNVSKRGWDYEYHYSTPSEVVKYKKALENNEPWALERQIELDKNRLHPPKITRYFNTWIVFILVSFLVAYFYSGITIDIFKIVPSVVDNIEQASEESTRMELEQKVNEEKTNTFINLAHETKTPLTLINNYLDEYIKKHGDNKEMEIIKWNVQRLTTDIVNFFDLERFNKGFSIYDHNQISDLSRILSYKLTLFKSLAKKKNIVIEEEIEENCFILAHPAAVERIINNLVENSLKYTRENGQVKVSLVAQDDQLCFSVVDTGIGIPAHLHLKIFEPYFQLSNHVKLNEGMGMGLSIVKKIVDDMKGAIILKSQLDQGTEIKVLLPRYIVTKEEQLSQYDISMDLSIPVSYMAPNDKIFGPSRSFILIVEDNKEMLNYLTENLGDRYNVYVAMNGIEALKKLDSITHLDLIISDIMMDEMDGLEFCKTISLNASYRHIPFIFLTAKTTALDKLNGLKLGAIDYIEKPFLIDQLILKIEAVLANLEKQRLAIVKHAYSSLLKTNTPSPATVTELPSREYEMNCRKYNLTHREIEIIELIVKGQPYKIIGDSLNISNRTVDRHVSNIFSKLSVNNKIELINKLNGK